MSEEIVVKKVTLLDVYNELVEVKEKQDDLCRKIGEYNGLHERLDQFDARCKFNLTDAEGVYIKLNRRIERAEDILEKAEHVDEGKNLLGKRITTIVFFIIAIIGGLSGLIALLRTLVQMLD